MIYDFAVIGSGVSGGRIAYELTHGGAHCLLLEAGREYGASTFPNNELDYSTQLFWGGGLELSIDGRMGFLRGKCLGGTSVVNQALLDRFDSLAWENWKEWSKVSFFDSQSMERHYSACEKELSVSEISSEYHNKNAKIFIQAFQKQGYRWSPLHRAQKDCKLDQGSDCIVCLGGCPRNSKQSSLVTTLRWAQEKGLHTKSEFEVHHLADQKERVKIYGFQHGKPVEQEAKQVILAAGSLGNAAILMRSELGKKLPALGTRFSCHPQAMTYALFDEPIDAHKGAFQAVKSDDQKLRKMGFKLENVFAPPIGTAMLIPGYGLRHLILMKKYRFMASIEVAIQDEPIGRISLTRSGKVQIHKRLTRMDTSKIRSGLKLVKELFMSIGAKQIIPCQQLFGLHLMGGCPMGLDQKTAVVNPEFRVYGHPSLGVADSSIFPSAPGINPSFTIMALSHKASQIFLRTCP